MSCAQNREHTMTTIHSRRLVDITLDFARQAAMRRTFAVIAALSILVLAPGGASAEVVLSINFESPDVAPGEISTDYSALEAVGVTVASARGIVEDLDDDWGISGSSGSQFIGVNGSPSDILRLEFDRTYTGVSIGCALSNGGAGDEILSLTLFNGADVAFYREYTNGAIGAWQAFFSFGDIPFDAIEVESPEGAPFGCDTLELYSTDLPETGADPVSLTMWAAVLAGLGSMLVRRRARS